MYAQVFWLIHTQCHRVIVQFTCMHKSCMHTPVHTPERVTARISTSHGAQMNESCHTYEHVMARRWGESWQRARWHCVTQCEAKYLPALWPLCGLSKRAALQKCKGKYMYLYIAYTYIYIVHSIYVNIYHMYVYIYVCIYIWSRTHIHVLCLLHGLRATLSKEPLF